VSEDAPHRGRGRVTRAAPSTVLGAVCVRGRSTQRGGAQTTRAPVLLARCGAGADRRRVPDCGATRCARQHGCRPRRCRCWRRPRRLHDEAERRVQASSFPRRWWCRNRCSWWSPGPAAGPAATATAPPSAATRRVRECVFCFVNAIVHSCMFGRSLPLPWLVL